MYCTSRVVQLLAAVEEDEALRHYAVPGIDACQPYAVPVRPGSLAYPDPDPQHGPSSGLTGDPAAAELDATEALSQLFQLRLEGWRKFHAVAVADLLRASSSPETHQRGQLRQLEPAGRSAWAAAAALRPRRPASSPTRFRVVSTRLVPSRVDG